MIEHRLRHQVPGSSSIDFGDEFEDEDEEDESGGMVLNIDREYRHDDQDLDDLDDDEQGRQENNEQSSDENSLHLQIIRVEACDDEPAYLAIEKTHCPIKHCRQNRPNSIRVSTLPGHLEEMHMLSRQDPRLRIFEKVNCLFPNCSSKLSLKSIEDHVSNMHNKSSTTRCNHVDCKDNQHPYSPKRLKQHIRDFHTSMTIELDLLDYQTSEVLYDSHSYYNFSTGHRVELFCFIPGCGAPLRSWKNLHRHAFIAHGIQEKLEKIQAAASGSANVSFNNKSNHQERQDNEPTRVGEVGVADDHGVGYAEEEEEEEDLGDDISDEDSDDGNISGEDSDDDVVGEEDNSACDPEDETVKRRYEIWTILNCAIDVKTPCPSVWLKSFVSADEVF